MKIDLTPLHAQHDAKNTESQQNGLSQQKACNLIERTKLVHITQQQIIKSWRENDANLHRGSKEHS